jgi:hypothetical protein
VRAAKRFRGSEGTKSALVCRGSEEPGSSAIIRYPGNPIIVGKARGKSSNRCAITITMFSHEPLELWTTPPKPTVRNGALFARVRKMTG